MADSVATDGQSLASQDPGTQAMFQAVYGNDAGTQWVDQHNAAVGSPAAAAQTAANTANPGTTINTGTNANDVQIAQIQAQSASNQQAQAAQAAQIADQQVQAAAAATAAANAQDFAEKVNEFNQTHALALQQFGLSQTQAASGEANQVASTFGFASPGNGSPGSATSSIQAGTPTLANLQQQFNQLVQAAGLTGQFQGQQTQQAQQQAFQQALALAQLTGQYNAPTAPSAPGAAAGAGAQAAMPTAADFAKLPQTVQDQYNQYNNGNGAAKWVQDATAAVQAATQSAQQSAPAAGPVATDTTGGGGAAATGGTQTLAGQLQAFNEQLQQAQLAMQQQAQQASLSGLQANGTPTESTQQFNTTTASDMAKLASTLTGPADYFQYLTSLNNGNSIISGLNGSQAPQPAFSTPAGPTQPQSLQNILGSLAQGGSISGITPAGSPQAPMPDKSGATTASPMMVGANNAMSPTGTGMGGSGNGSDTATSGGALSPAGSTGGTTSGTGISIPGFESFGSLPHPQQINPVNWDSLGSTGQQFMLGAYSAAGYDPNSVQSMINATRPAGQYASAGSGAASPSSGTTQFAPQAASQGAFG